MRCTMCFKEKKQENGGTGLRTRRSGDARVCESTLGGGLHGAQPGYLWPVAGDCGLGRREAGQRALVGNTAGRRGSGGGDAAAAVPARKRSSGTRARAKVRGSSRREERDSRVPRLTATWTPRPGRDLRLSRGRGGRCAGASVRGPPGTPPPRARRHVGPGGKAGERLRRRSRAAAGQWIPPLPPSGS